MSVAKVLAEDRLIRNSWSDSDEAGRQLLCLYTAMMDDPNARPGGCPASVCPKWLAYLLPWMDDSGSAEAWPALVARVAELAPRFGQIPSKVEWQVRAACVKEAMGHTQDEDVLRVCQGVTDVVEKFADGNATSEELAAAEAAAAEAAAAAARAAAEAAAAARAASSDKLASKILDLIEASSHQKELTKGD